MTTMTNTSQKGFTLVETMVAITVLAIALVGPFTAVQNALTASYVARDELTASALAQEGMEYIRSIRDNNYLNNRTGGWMDGLSTKSCFSSVTSYCTVDPTQGDFHTTAAAMVGFSDITNVPVLNISSAGLYNHQAQSSTNVPTRFTRTVQLRQVTATEVQVTVVVTWISAHQTYSVTVVDNLQDWL